MGVINASRFNSRWYLPPSPAASLSQTVPYTLEGLWVVLIDHITNSSKSPRYHPSTISTFIKCTDLALSSLCNKCCVSVLQVQHLQTDSDVDPRLLLLKVG